MTFNFNTIICILILGGLAQHISAQTTPIPSTKNASQPFIDALSKYWGTPNPASSSPGNPPASVPPLASTFTVPDLSQNMNAYNSYQSLISFTGYGNNGVGFSLKSIPSGSQTNIQRFLCLTENTMPEMQKKDYALTSASLFSNKSQSSQALRFTSSGSCNASQKARTIANAYRAVKFFNAAATQCLNTYGNPAQPASAKTKALQTPMMAGTGDHGKLASNLQPCSQRDVIRLMVQAKNTLVSFANNSNGHIPFDILGAQNMNLLHDQYKDAQQQISQAFTPPPGLKLSKNESFNPNYASGYKRALTMMQKNLKTLDDILQQALMLQLNHDSGKKAYANSNPYMMSIATLVNSHHFSDQDISNVNSWIQTIASQFSPNHYVAPGFTIKQDAAQNNNGIYIFGQGRLLNLATLDNANKSVQQQVFKHTKDKKGYVAPSDVSNYRSSQDQTIQANIQKYTDDVAKMGFLKNAALGSLSMLVAERTPIPNSTDDKPSSFIAKLHTNATARSGKTYNEKIAQLKPVGLMREQLKLMADIRYQLFLNYMAQERVQASLAMMQLNKLHTSVDQLNSQYQQIQKQIKKYQNGEDGGGIDPSSLTANPAPGNMPGMP